ncbi:MAG: hypothetical protein PF542_05455 [Nanoarchaeota archaeon]|jgi:hypothetical protein|nr:hypothetical protein [Nanoarchaeota archaeon]
MQKITFESKEEYWQINNLLISEKVANLKLFKDPEPAMNDKDFIKHSKELEKSGQKTMNLIELFCLIEALMANEKDPVSIKIANHLRNLFEKEFIRFNTGTNYFAGKVEGEVVHDYGLPLEQKKPCSVVGPDGFVKNINKEQFVIASTGKKQPDDLMKWLTKKPFYLWRFNLPASTDNFYFARLYLYSNDSVWVGISVPVSSDGSLRVKVTFAHGQKK